MSCREGNDARVSCHSSVEKTYGKDYGPCDNARIPEGAKGKLILAWMI